MNKFLLVICCSLALIGCSLALIGCSSMNFKPTVGVSVGTSI